MTEPAAGSSSEPADEYTIDELAQKSGFTARNIRSFQVHGMLPPPARRGRLGYYGPAHLERLRLIERLQGDGFSRAAIGSLVKAWEAGHSLGDVLGFEEELTSFFHDAPMPRISMAALEKLFGNEPAVLDTAVRIGFLIPDEAGGEFSIANPTLMAIGGELRAASIPLDVAMDQAEFLRDRSDEIAEHFVDMFQKVVWQPFVDRGAPQDELAEVTERLRRFKPLIARSVNAALDESMAKAVSRFVKEINLPDLIGEG
ncbi:MAG: MerR family transcriptional regulator [Actinobacteria bacterium]|nr:MerR family transcriptional regulator [Actinomycetota bacterium]